MELKVGDKVRVNAVESNSRMNCVNGTISYIDETYGEYKYFVEVEAAKIIPYSADELDFLERPTESESQVQGDVTLTADETMKKLKLQINGFDIGLIESDPFGRVLDEMFELHQKKNHDYGDSFSALFKDFGMVYPVPRIYEKAMRLKTLLRAENKVNESVRDTLLDIASYAVMTIVELDNQK